jgi:multiple sugar transport system permease protein
MRRRLQPFPWLLLAPFLTALVLFWAIPLAQGFWLSLQSDELFGDTTFIGFLHYREIWQDSRFLHAIRNTCLYAAISIPTVTLFSLGLASLLRKAHKGWRGPLLLTLMLPGLTPPAVLALLYLLVFNGPHGLLNALLLKPLALPAVDWLRDPHFIKAALMLQTLWRWGGFVTLIILSGLEGIPREYQHIGRVEGANAWQVFTRITLPLLTPVLGFVAAFLFLDAFVLFEGSYILLGGSGGTLDAGLLLVAYTYYTAFTLGHFGSAAAMGFTLVPILMLLTFAMAFPVWGKKKSNAIPSYRNAGVTP